jgi:DNA gyrase inhibitor GyrI
MKKITALLGLSFILSACQHTDKPGQYKGYELPAYTVLQKQGNIEIREYPSQLVAQTSVEGERDEAANQGFRTLADYIFGNNQGNTDIAMTTPVQQIQGRKIDMTTPVTQQQTGNNDWIIQFKMPSSYTVQTLPKPNNPKVEIVQTAPFKMVVIRFSGVVDKAATAKNLRALDEYIRAQSLTLVGSHHFSFYDDPFTLPWNRRNEIWYLLD